MQFLMGFLCFVMCEIWVCFAQVELHDKAVAVSICFCFARGSFRYVLHSFFVFLSFVVFGVFYARKTYDEATRSEQSIQFVSF